MWTLAALESDRERDREQGDEGSDLDQQRKDPWSDRLDVFGRQPRQVDEALPHHDERDDFELLAHRGGERVGYHPDQLIDLVGEKD